ncbi:MAG: FecR family protein [Pseudomonadota bacterium]
MTDTNTPNRHPPGPPADEDQIGQIIRAAGGRAALDPAARARIRSEARAQWQARYGRGARRTTTTRWQAPVMALAAAVLVGLGLALFLPRATPPVLPVPALAGEVVQAHGFAERRVGAPPSSWRRLAQASRLVFGTQVRTGQGGRLRLDLTDGVSLRLDHGTELVLERPQEIRLLAGRVYIDAGDKVPATPGQAAAAPAIIVRTPYGDVSDVGTQFVVALAEDTMRVAVRDGRIELRTPPVREQAIEGEALIVSRARGIRRDTTALGGDEWRWAESLASPFTLADSSVDAFLRWVAQESGRELVYGDAAAEARAQSIRLQGELRELTPSQALAPVMATTDLIVTEHERQLVVTSGRMP